MENSFKKKFFSVLFLSFPFGYLLRIGMSVLIRNRVAMGAEALFTYYQAILSKLQNWPGLYTCVYIIVVFVFFGTFILVYEGLLQAFSYCFRNRK